MRPTGQDFEHVESALFRLERNLAIPRLLQAFRHHAIVRAVSCHLRFDRSGAELLPGRIQIVAERHGRAGGIHAQEVAGLVAHGETGQRRHSRNSGPRSLGEIRLHRSQRRFVYLPERQHLLAPLPVERFPADLAVRTSDCDIPRYPRNVCDGCFRQRRAEPLPLDRLADGEVPEVYAVRAAVRRVGHKHGVFPDFVDHHEMPLFPVHDAGQGRFVFQLLEREARPDGFESDALRRLADAEKAHPFAADVALLAQGFQGVVPPVVPCHHLHTGRPAVHGVVLVGEGEGAGHGFMFLFFR